MKKIPRPTRPGLMSRRLFLGGVMTAPALFQVVPGHVLGLNGAQPASEKLNIAGIGVGGQGGYDIKQFTSENVVALCDVDWAHAANSFKAFPAARKFRDYRVMLDELKEIDAVVVATPDHSHAFASMAAIKRGKHVYCEKPLTHSIWEARQIVAAAREHKVATQMGNQAQASEETRRFCEMIWAGAIGTVREVHLWTDRPANGLFKEYWPQGIDRPTDKPPVPSTLEWDLWLGPAPERPYHPAYLPAKWRGWWDFGTGALGDIACHTFDAVFRALKLGPPSSVEATSTRVNEETYPLASMITYQFPARDERPAVKLIWYDGGLRPARPPELESGRPMDLTGKLIVGDRGKIISQDREYRLIPESRAREFQMPVPSLPRSPGHYQEWVDACKGGKAAGSNFDFAGPLTEAVLLGNVALRAQLRTKLVEQTLLWDSANLRIGNLDEANRFLRREYRAGWVL